MVFLVKMTVVNCEATLSAETHLAIACCTVVPAQTGFGSMRNSDTSSTDFGGKNVWHLAHLLKLGD